MMSVIGGVQIALRKTQFLVVGPHTSRTIQETSDMEPATPDSASKAVKSERPAFENDN